jgi:hypothetical protein
MQSGPAKMLLTNRMLGGTLLAVGVALLCGAAAMTRPQGQSAVALHAASRLPIRSDDRRAAVAKSFGHLPLSFEANQGQTDPAVRYLARSGASTIFLTDDGATLAMTRQEMAPGITRGSADPRDSLKLLASRGRKVRTCALKLAFDGMNTKASPRGIVRLPGATNYLVGSDPAKWHSGIPNFERVKYSSLYPGVDLEFYGTNGRLEYDIDVAPGANPNAVKMRIEGAERLALDHAGNLVASVGGESAMLGKPLAYQEIDGVRHAVKANFALQGASGVTLALGRYDHRAPLVIDPAIMYSTFEGGTIAEVQALAVDGAGNAYIAGWTSTNDFPVNGGVQAQLNGIDNAIVAKLSPTGTNFIYSTYLGGSQMDIATGIGFDSAGNAYVSGYTDSPNFPTQPAGGTTLSGGFDAFIAALNPSGSGLVYSRYLGGSADDLATGVAVDPAGTAYVVGQTFSTDFPTTDANAYQAANPSGGAVSAGFLTRIDPGGVLSPSYSTYFGGPAPTSTTASGVTFLNGAAFGGVTGNVYVVGAGGGTAPTTVGPAFGGLLDAVVANFDTTQASSASLVFSRFIGGSSIDVATGVSTQAGCTSECPAVVSGYTFSGDIPGSTLIFNGAEDGFVAKVDSRNGLSNFAYIGTSGYDEAAAANLDPSGNQLVGGTTFRPVEFLQVDQLQPTPGISGGIFISTDLGASFTAPSGWKSIFGSVSAQALAVDKTVPLNEIPTGEIIYAGTNSEGLFRSTDNGKTFQSTGMFGGVQISAVGVAQSTGQGPQAVFVTTGAVLYVSVDGGVTFVKLSALPNSGGLPTNANFVLSDFTFGFLSGNVNTNALVWQGNKNGFYVSTDAGVNFTPSTGIAAPNQVTQVFSGAEDIARNTLYIGTDKGIFKSTDSGFTFAPTIVNSSVIFSMAIDTTAENPTPSVTVTPPQESATAVPTPSLSAGQATPGPVIVYAGTYGDGVYASTDGFIAPQHLTHTVIEPNSRFHYVAVDDVTANPATVYSGLGDSQRFGTVWASTDAGNTFSAIGGPNFRETCCMFPLVVGNGELFAAAYEESDAFIFELAKAGISLQFADTIGGSNYDEVTGVGTDSNGDAYLAGLTFSPDYPSLNAARPSFGGSTNSGVVNGFTTKIGFTSTSALKVPSTATFPGKETLRTVAKQPLTVVLSNSGTSPLYLGYVHVDKGDSNDFFIVPGIAKKIVGKKAKGAFPACGTTIPAKGQCGISLAFEPFGLGQRVSLLLIPSNSNNGDQQVLLVGNGKAPPKAK